jgi:hypothetical protein
MASVASPRASWYLVALIKPGSSTLHVVRTKDYEDFHQLLTSAAPSATSGSSTTSASSATPLWLNSVKTYCCAEHPLNEVTTSVNFCGSVYASVDGALMVRNTLASRICRRVLCGPVVLYHENRRGYRVSLDRRVLQELLSKRKFTEEEQVNLLKNVPDPQEEKERFLRRWQQELKENHNFTAFFVTPGRETSEVFTFLPSSASLHATLLHLGQEQRACHPQYLVHRASLPVSEEKNFSPKQVFSLLACEFEEPLEETHQDENDCALARYFGLSAHHMLALTTDRCWVCHREAAENHKFFRCSVCRLARYCGEQCQHSDWAEHKKLCHVLEALDSRYMK